MIFVYILKSLKSGTLYIGQSNNLKDRIRRHNSGSIKSTKSKAPWKIVYFEEHDSRAAAMVREWEIKKKFNTERRKKLIDSFNSSKLI